MAVPTAVFPSRPDVLEPVAGRPLGLAELIELVRAVAAREDVWRPKLRFPQGADRWWTRLHNGAHVDV